MGVCTKFYSYRIRWGSVPRFTPKESDGGLYQVLLLKNQMGVVPSFTPKESDGGLYQVLLLKNQMVVCTKFDS